MIPTGDQEQKIAAWMASEHAISGVKDWVLCIANRQCGEADVMTPYLERRLTKVPEHLRATLKGLMDDGRTGEIDAGALASDYNRWQALKDLLRGKNHHPGRVAQPKAADTIALPPALAGGRATDALTASIAKPAKPVEEARGRRRANP